MSDRQNDAVLRLAAKYSLEEGGRSSDVRPYAATHNLTDKALGYAVFRSKRNLMFSVRVSPPNGSDVAIRQAGASVRFAPPVAKASFGIPVGCVVGVGSEEQVRRVYARRVVAGVADAEAPAWVAQVGEGHDAMCANRLPVPLHYAVPEDIEAARPHPAVGAVANLGLNAGHLFFACHNGADKSVVPHSGHSNHRRKD